MTDVVAVIHCQGCKDHGPWAPEPQCMGIMPVRLAAQTPPDSGAVGELVGRMRPFYESFEFQDREMGAWSLMVEAADALTSLQARVEQLEGVLKLSAPGGSDHAL